MQDLNGLLLGYLPIVIFLGIALGFATVMIVAAYLLAPQRPDSEKISAYECGFEAFDDARSRFDVRFYLVAILFIIFDLEVAFLFPWAVALLAKIGMLGFLVHDVVLGSFDDWFRLRMEKRRFGLGVEDLTP